MKQAHLTRVFIEVSLYLGHDPKTSRPLWGEGYTYQPKSAAPRGTLPPMLYGLKQGIPPPFTVVMIWSRVSSTKGAWVVEQNTILSQLFYEANYGLMPSQGHKYVPWPGFEPTLCCWHHRGLGPALDRSATTHNYAICQSPFVMHMLRKHFRQHKLKRKFNLRKQLLVFKRY